MAENTRKVVLELLARNRAAGENEQYEVVFAGMPGYRLDGRRDFWRITIELRQSSP